MSDAESTLTTYPNDASILARWEQLGRLPIPIAFNDRGLVWKTIVDLAVYFAIPRMLVNGSRRWRGCWRRKRDTARMQAATPSI